MYTYDYTLYRCVITSVSIGIMIMIMIIGLRLSCTGDVKTWLE